MFRKEGNAATIETTFSLANVEDADLEQVSGGIIPLVVGGIAVVAGSVWLYNQVTEVLDR